MTAQPYLRPDDCHCGSSMGQDHARGCPQLYRPYKVLIALHDGDRVLIKVNAMGMYDAKGVGYQTAIDRGLDPICVIRVEEVDPWEQHKGKDENELRALAGDR